jgi:hypothetical protein
MLPEVTLPASPAVLPGALRPCFSAPSFRTFCGLAAGLAGQVRRRTVTGMLPGAGLSRCWPHDRAHHFFARARWDIDELGLAVARLAVLLLVPAGAALTVAAGDTLFRRRGRRVCGAGWQYDGSSPSPGRTGFGTCFVTCGIVVYLPFLIRPGCRPVPARLVLPGAKAGGGRAGKNGATKTGTAVALLTVPAGAFPGRPLHVVAGAAYHGPALKDLPATVTWTCRLPANAVLDALAAPRLAGPGRPARTGKRPGTPAGLARSADWARGTVPAHGRRQDTDLAAITCLWYGCTGTRTIRAVLAKGGRSTLLAPLTTGRHARPAALVTRYAARWSSEQAFAGARNTPGAGETRTRVRRAVERTVPFALLTCTLVITWYARNGHCGQAIAARRASEPWYRSKAAPAFEDMLTALRRALITARISEGSQAEPTPQQTRAVLAAWHAAAA